MTTTLQQFLSIHNLTLETPADPYTLALPGTYWCPGPSGWLFWQHCDVLVFCDGEHTRIVDPDNLPHVLVMHRNGEWNNSGYGEPVTGTIEEVRQAIAALRNLEDYADARLGIRNVVDHVTEVPIPPRTLEVCSSREALRSVCGLDWSAVDDDVLPDALDEFVTDLFTALEELDFQVVDAKADRCTFYGWNGSNLHRWKYGPVLTFGVLSPNERDTIEDVVRSVHNSTVREWGTLVE
jgi:hypothetical protein